MKTPFFSIVIPTYNRAEFLNQAVKSIFFQNFNDYEIIISDNASTDNTKELVAGFKDKRIKYFRNLKNLGAEKNIQKALSYATGRYLFTLGDDDMILFSDTLRKIYNIINEKKVGFVRINLIEKFLHGKGLRKSIIIEEKDIYIKNNTSSIKIIDFIHKIAAGHIAGLIIKNEYQLANNYIDCPNTPWIKIIFSAIHKYGGYYLSGKYMVITWSQGSILNYYDIPDNKRLVFEDYTDYIFSLIPRKKLSDYKYHYLSNFIGLQPVIKLYSSNLNLVKFNIRLLEIEPRLKSRLSFWLYFSIAFLIPKFVWKFVRTIQHLNTNNLSRHSDNIKILKRYHDFMLECIE